MLGTISLIALFVTGFMHYSWLLLIFFTVLNSFLGVHFPQGKAQMLAARGEYWKTILVSAPLQFILAALIFGLGYGCGALLN